MFSDLRSVTLSLPVLALTAGAASAATVIDFNSSEDAGGNFADPPAAITGQDLDGDTFTDDSIRGLAFNPTTPLNDGVGSYTGPDLFVGLVGERLNASSGAWDTNALSSFSWRYQESTGETASYGLGYYVPDSPAAAGYQFGGGSFIGFSEDATGSVDGLNRTENYETRRFLVRDINGNLFVSQTQFGDSADTRVLDETELVAELWAAFSPTTGSTATDFMSQQFDPGSATFNVTTASLNATGLAGFGWVVNDANFDDGNRNWFQYNRFYVDAIAIPEPAGLSVLALGTLTLLARRRAG